MSEDNNSQGQVVPETTQGESDKPQYLTSEQFNKALTARMKAEEKKAVEFQKTFTETVLSQVGELLNAKLDALKPAVSAEPAANSKSGKQAEAVEDNPQIKELLKQVNDLKAANQRASSERDASNARARDAALRQSVTAELAKYGVDASRAKHAIAFLVDSSKAVGYEDANSENIVFRGIEDYDLDLSSGVKAWLNSDDGKLYSPPKGTSGSGDRGGQTAQRPVSPRQTNLSDLGNMVLNVAKITGINS